eukprot:c13762_g1_i3.p2 GENE.c13762_g1_i3~~c13762_g1_i3.p2  ORF type:complete len:110 (+),score=22.35 c13762_g1_i3:29-358(+)
MVVVWLVVAVALFASFVLVNIVVGILKQRRDAILETQSKELFAKEAVSPTPVILLTGFLGAGDVSCHELPSLFPPSHHLSHFLIYLCLESSRKSSAQNHETFRVIWVFL